MSILKLSSIRLGRFQADAVIKADGEDLVGKATLRGLLDINGARAIDVAGAFADQVDFTIKPDRLAGEFTNEKGICTVRFYRDSEEAFGLSINPVSLHAAKVTFKDKEHRIRITLEYGKQTHRVLSEFFAENTGFTGYIAISPDQLAIPVGDEEKPAEQPKRSRRKKDVVDPVVAAAASKGGAGASAPVN